MAHLMLTVWVLTAVTFMLPLLLLSFMLLISIIIINILTAQNILRIIQI